MLVVYQYGVPTQARFESWTELMQNWTKFFGHSEVPGPLAVRKGVQGKLLAQGVTKWDIFAFARTCAEKEKQMNCYKAEASRRAARARSLHQRFSAWPSHIAATLA